MLLDLGIVLAFVIYSVSAGFLYRRTSSRSLEEYFLAGRTLKGWQAGFSMAATQFAADTPLLVTGLIATGGIFALWRLWVYALAFLLMGFVLGGPWRRAGVLTDAELTELRYGGQAALALRVFKALHLGTMVNCTVLAMVLIAAVRIAEPVLVWRAWLPAGTTEPLANFLAGSNAALTTLPDGHPDYWLASADNLISILAIVFFVWLYSATGGLRSVVATDVVQFSVAMVATFAYAWIVVERVGGLTALGHKLSALYGEGPAGRLLAFGPPGLGETSGLLFAVLAVQWFAQVNADGTGYLAQRTMACRSEGDARIAAVIFSFAQIVVRSLLWIPIALGLLLLYPVGQLPQPGTDPEEFRMLREAAFATGIADLLPAGIRGLMLTGMLAALASTVDTHLNWGASYWANDLYRRLLMEKFLQRTPSARELVWAARFSTMAILGVALLIAVNLRSIQAAWHLSLLFGSGLGVTMILRWLWWRINRWGEGTAVAVSLGLSPLLLFGFPEASEGARMLWMVALSTVVVVTVTMATPPESTETLRAFYRAARPPGFWGPVARGLREDPGQPRRTLGRALLAIGFCCVTLYGLLVGIGRLLIQDSVGVQALVPLALISTALAAIPFWKAAALGK